GHLFFPFAKSRPRYTNFSWLSECCGIGGIGVSGTSTCVVAADTVLILCVASQAGVGETRDVCSYNRNLCEHATVDGSLDLKAGLIARIVFPREIDLSLRNYLRGELARRCRRRLRCGTGLIRVGAFPSGVDGRDHIVI